MCWLLFIAHSFCISILLLLQPEMNGSVYLYGDSIMGDGRKKGLRTRQQGKVASALARKAQGSGGHGWLVEPFVGEGPKGKIHIQPTLYYSVRRYQKTSAKTDYFRQKQ